MTGDTPEYVLGTDAVELERLGVQHRLWADATHALWRRAGVGLGARVLDVGCGPGYASVDLAQLVGPAGAVVGVDESAGFVAQANRRFEALGLAHAFARTGDVQRLAGALADQPAGFDAAYARWVLCFVPDPAAVVAGVGSLLAPGGRLAVQDYFNYHTMTVAPRDDRCTLVVDAIERSWRDRGGDPDVFARLPELLDAAGFDLVHLDVRQRLARPGEPMMHWPDTFWTSVLPRLVATGYLTEAQADDFRGLWTAVRDDPHRFVMPPPVFELVAVKR